MRFVHTEKVHWHISYFFGFMLHWQEKSNHAYITKYWMNPRVSFHSSINSIDRENHMRWPSYGKYVYCKMYDIFVRYISHTPYRGNQDGAHILQIGQRISHAGASYHSHYPTHLVHNLETFAIATSIFHQRILSFHSSFWAKSDPVSKFQNVKLPTSCKTWN